MIPPVDPGAAPANSGPRVAFFGSPAFAVPVLEAVRAHFPVVLVVTQPDKPVGRGLRLTPPPLAAHAAAVGLPLAQPARLRGPSDFAAQLRASGADVAVTCAYGKILPAELLTVPRYGFLNTHTSLLPRYRGAAPIQWALINGETVTGTTIMQTDPGLDTGPVLLQEALPIEPAWTAVELAAALQVQAARLIVEVLGQLDHLVPQPQDHAAATHAPLLTKADGEVRWDESAQAIVNRARGVAVWPQTSAMLDGVRLKLHDLSAGERLPSLVDVAPGTVLEIQGEAIVVACGEGSLQVGRVQPEARTPLPAAQWWRARSSH
jgi:methionyl-tRNA formyltransferase